MKKVLGLDVSTTCVGIAIVSKGKTVEPKLVMNEALKLTKSGKPAPSLEKRAEVVAKTLASLFKKHKIDKVIIEAPIEYMASKSTAHTMAVLNQFNGMVSYIVRTLHGKDGKKVSVKTVRKKVGIPMYKGKKKGDKKKKAIKKLVIEHMDRRFENFTYELTPKGNPRPTTDDRADAIALALFGVL